MVKPASSVRKILHWPPPLPRSCALLGLNMPWVRNPGFHYYQGLNSLTVDV